MFNKYRLVMSINKMTNEELFDKFKQIIRELKIKSKDGTCCSLPGCKFTLKF